MLNRVPQPHALEWLLVLIPTSVWHWQLPQPACHRQPWRAFSWLLAFPSAALDVPRRRGRTSAIIYRMWGNFPGGMGFIDSSFRRTRDGR
jgi:hypothetical protein